MTTLKVGIANYDEIRRLLKSSRYRRWVED